MEFRGDARSFKQPVYDDSKKKKQRGWVRSVIFLFFFLAFELHRRGIFCIHFLCFRNQKKDDDRLYELFCDVPCLQALRVHRPDIVGKLGFHLILIIEYAATLTCYIELSTRCFFDGASRILLANIAETTA